MARVLLYTIGKQPFRVPVPGGVIVFGTTPEERDLTAAELEAIEERRKTAKALKVTPVSRRAAEQLGAQELAAARDHAAAIEAELGGRIAELEVSIDTLIEQAQLARDRHFSELAAVNTEKHELEARLAAQLDEHAATLRHVAKLEDAGVALEAARQELAGELARVKKELEDARTKNARLEAQKKR